MQLKLGSRRRALVAASAVVLLVFLGLLMPGCAIDTHAYLADPHAYLWDGHTVTELPNTLGGTFSEANDVNAWDWAVGWAEDENGINRAVMWKYGKMYRLPSLWGGESAALAINDLGQVVGWESDESYSSHAVLWSLGRARDLAKRTWTSSRAWDINNLGQVVGSFTRDAVDKGQAADRYTTDETTHPFSWRCGLVKEFADAGEAYVVNALGCIGGWVEDDGDASDPWLYNRLCSTTLREVDTEEELDSAVEGLNDCLTGAGWSNDAGSFLGDPMTFPLAVSWSCGRMTLLPLPDGMEFSAARDINLVGDIVGEVGRIDLEREDCVVYAAIWSGGKVRFIPSLGGGALRNYSNAINVKGHVVGASEKVGISDLGPSRVLGTDAVGLGDGGSGGRATMLLYDAGGALIAELNDQTAPSVRSADELLGVLAQPAYANTARIVLRLESYGSGGTETADWTFLWEDGVLKTAQGETVLAR